MTEFGKNRSQFSNLVVLGIFLLALIGATVIHLRGNGTETPSPSADDFTPPPRMHPPQGPMRGASLQLHSGDTGNHAIPYERYIDQIAATGANTISMVLPGYQENCASTSIFLDIRKTPSNDRLRELIKYAHDRGLNVVFMPIVLLENPRQGEWRGKIAPTQWSDWWGDYTSFIMRYVWLAEETGVEVFVIGSELVSTESQVQRWEELIAKIRQSYRGLLSYSANWDHYKPVKFWDKLDIVGMTSYYDLTGGKEANLENLMQGWKPIKEEVLAWQATVNRPILFTEVGWPNQTTCAQYPWDYTRSTTSPDPRAQANCFESFFRTWSDEPAVAGMLVWEWQNYPGQDTSPNTDTSYVPCDKPAMEVIRRHFRHDSELAAPDESEPQQAAASDTN